ncbi:hypothetical protein IGI04_043054 [Brassica rapa subsp. trilocularis]|uniref:Uncharacterized protein n=1 Tax=Brassica rapa subsp. trilocularis TaxID=1813537 RepID=A0ABQ7KGY0_BRACM|nr:hypothetical protein IGI04_043054 [Brassica rapa subsp. trilocularis]
MCTSLGQKHPDLDSPVHQTSSLCPDQYTDQSTGRASMLICVLTCIRISPRISPRTVHGKGQHADMCGQHDDMSSVHGSVHGQSTGRASMLICEYTDQSRDQYRTATDVGQHVICFGQHADYEFITRISPRNQSTDQIHGSLHGTVPRDGQLLICVSTGKGQHADLRVTGLTACCYAVQTGSPLSPPLPVPRTVWVVLTGTGTDVLRVADRRPACVT